MVEHHFNLPATIEDVRKLRAGDVVYLTGEIITARDQAHKRALQYTKESKQLPVSFEGKAVFFCGPLVRQVGTGWEILAAGPTTSSRMDPYEPEFIASFNPRFIIGKGPMAKPTVKALKDHGAVYLAYTGGAAVLAAQTFKKVVRVEWLDLGSPEALWVLHAEKFGPSIVAIDSHGRSLYEEIDAIVTKQMAKLVQGT